jgi:hypothetical protein
MKRTATLLLGMGLALNGIAQLPAYDTSVYTFIRSAATDSMILGQQAWYRSQNVAIAGAVTDERQQPLPGATVTLGNGQHQVTTDAAGRFSIELQPNALRPYNVVSVTAPGRKTEAQTLHWTALPATLTFQLVPITRCGCPPDTVVDKCCGIHIRMTVDQLFEKEARTTRTPKKQAIRSKRRTGARR